MESLLICLLVTILVIHPGNATLTISVDTDPILPGNDVTLTCVSDQMVGTFVWQHNGGLVALGTFIMIPTRFMVANTGTQSVLTIIGFENDLDGTWDCLNFGTESTSVSLSVDEASCLQTEGEPCDTELKLTDWHRSIRYTTQSGDVLISDYFFNDGWYRLMTEGQRTDITMPTSYPAEFQCGTWYPIWINGTYPEVDDTINVVKGCVNILDEPCRYELELCIKACGNAEERYYVHYLVDTPGSNMGYCTDSLLPCSNGTSSVTGFPPCAGNFPVLEGEPVLSFKEEPTGVSAYCDYSMLWSGEEDIDFFVRWFIDGEFVTDGPRLSKISDEFDCGTGFPYQCILNRRAGSNIECEVSSKFKDQDAYSQGIKSNLLYAGLIVLPNNTIEFVGESEDGETFEVTSTIPIVCRQVNAICVPRISINVDLNGENDAVADACSRFVEYESPASFNIKAARDGYNDGDVANYVKFKVDVTSLIPVSRIWEELSTNLPTIKVVTKDVGIAKTCIGSGDPHYTTFDGWYYHIYQPGDYTFYQHRTLPIKIQSRVARCYRVACNCGVAVQVGHTHLIVDRCNNAGNYYVTYKTTHDGQIQKEIRTPTNTRVTTAEIFRNGEKTPGTVLQYKNRKFKIYLPTGSVLTITLFWSHFISLSLSASSDDFNNIDGLCGNFDKDPLNDGQYGPAGAATYDCSQPENCEPAIRNSVPSKNFYESWRVDDDENIFKGVLNVDKEFKIDRYCTCDENIVKCDYCNARTDNDPILDCDDGNRRRRRETIEEDPDDLVGTYEFGSQSENDKDFEPFVPGFPTASGLTEEYTKQLCNETLVNSTTYNLCLNAINNGSVTIDDIIEGCIVDVKVSDDVSLARQVISDLQIRCEVVLTKNPMYWEESENGTMAPPTALLGQLCVNECNDKGECVNGTCECNEGLGGSDCSISLAEPPLVFSVLGDGLCDIRTRPCRSAKIYGEYFAETGNITCHIQNINVSENGIRVLPTISTVAGLFRTPQEVKCPLPEPAVQPSVPGEGIVSSGYLISISNDGELKSEDMAIMIVYDSVCQVCNASEGECNMKNNSCNINGHCYASFDVNMNDCCQQCLPEISIDNWSVRQDDMAPTVLTSNPYPAIHQEQLNFTFDIEDHEQCSITFSMTSTNATISPQGKFVWLPSVSSSNEDSMFEITMHDKCGFSATVLFTVNICKCENSEVCAFVNGSSLYECVCPEQLDGVSCGNEAPTTYTQQLTDSTVNPTITVPHISSFPQEQDDSTTDMFDVTDTSLSGSTTTNYGNSNVGNISPKSSTNSDSDNLQTLAFTDNFAVRERTPTVNTYKTSTTNTQATTSTVSPTVQQISSFPQDQDEFKTGIFDFTETSPSGSTPVNYQNSNVGNLSPKPSTLNSGTDLKTSPLTDTITARERASTVNTNKTLTTYTQGADSTVNPTASQSYYSQDQTDISNATLTFQSGSTSTNYGNSNVGNLSTRSSSHSLTENMSTFSKASTEAGYPVDTTLHTTTNREIQMMSHNSESLSSFQHSSQHPLTEIDASSSSAGDPAASTSRTSTVNTKPTIEIGTSAGSKFSWSYSTKHQSRTSNLYTDVVLTKKVTLMKTTIPDDHGTTAIRNHETGAITWAQVSPSPTHFIEGTRSEENTSHTAPQANIDIGDLSNTTEPVSVTKAEVGSTILNTTPVKTTIPDGQETTAIRYHGTSGRASAQVNSSSTHYMESTRSEGNISHTAPQANTGLVGLSYTTESVSVTKTEVGSTILNKQAVNYQQAISLTLEGREVQWIRAKQAFRASVSRVVNLFCHSNARKCCSVAEFNKQDTLDGDVTTTENVDLNERISERLIFIHLSIKFNNYIETCSHNNEDRARRDVINQYHNLFKKIARRNTNEYISADVVKSSIEQGKTFIEAEILMDIVDISLYETEENEESGEDTKSYTVFIVVGACCFAGIGLLVFGVFFYKKYQGYSRETLIQVIPSRPTSVSDNRKSLKAISSGSLDGLFIAPSLTESRAGSPAFSVKAWDDNN